MFKGYVSVREGRGEFLLGMCVCVCDIKFGEFATPPRPKHTLESMEDLGGFLLVGLER